MTKKETLELRSKAHDALKKLHAEIGENAPTDEQDAQFEKLSADIEGYDAHLATLNDAAAKAQERAAKLNAADESAKRFNIGGRTPYSQTKRAGAMSNDEVTELSQKVLRTWSDPRNASVEDLEECNALGFKPDAKELSIKLAPTTALSSRNGVQKWAQGVNTIATGGALVMPLFVAELENALLAYGGLRNYARVIRTGTSAELPYPTLNTTSNTATIVGENAAVSATSLTFGQVKLRSYKYTPGYVPVSRELLRDSEFDMGSLLGNFMGESIGRGQAAHFISGTGTNQPMGVITAGTSGVTAAGSTAFTVAEMRSLLTSVDPAYRAQGAGWLMHDNTAVAISNLVGGDGQYLWKRDLASGNPATFDGYPVYIDNSMPSTLASGGKPIAFGMLSKYLIRDVGTIRIQRLSELHALNDQDSFVAFMETDANLLNAGTNPVKYMTLA